MIWKMEDIMIRFMLFLSLFYSAISSATEVKYIDPNIKILSGVINYDDYASQSVLIGSTLFYFNDFLSTDTEIGFANDGLLISQRLIATRKLNESFALTGGVSANYITEDFDIGYDIGVEYILNKKSSLYFQNRSIGDFFKGHDYMFLLGAKYDF